MVWDVDPARPAAPLLFAFNIGLATWETVDIIRKGANYGYSLREGAQMMSSDGDGRNTGRRYDSDTQSQTLSSVGRSDQLTRSYEYQHTAEKGGDAIAGGFVYHGGGRSRAQRQTRVRRHHDRPDLVSGTCRRDRGRRRQPGDRSRRLTTMDAGLRRLVEETYRARGAGEGLPGAAGVSGRGRVDFRFAVDNDGEPISSPRATG